VVVLPLQWTVDAHLSILGETLGLGTIDPIIPSRGLRLVDLVRPPLLLALLLQNGSCVHVEHFHLFTVDRLCDKPMPRLPCLSIYAAASMCLCASMRL
jgi:hypothetical protein